MTIPRYRFDGVDLVGGYPDGKWVKHEDHLAEVERLGALVASLENLDPQLVEAVRAALAEEAQDE